MEDVAVHHAPNESQIPDRSLLPMMCYTGTTSQVTPWIGLYERCMHTMYRDVIHLRTVA